ncbi:MAG: DUF4112 domain-containing protein [Hyphomicrobiaceae bacterium]|nr:DUF4112 domain-containing protein [Hyphomicrobiaceae bacterium]
MVERFKLPAAGAAVDPDFLARLHEIERLAVKFDSAFRLPWTRVRFGIDPIAGLVPVIGDLVMAGMGLRLVWLARSLGVDAATTARMMGNLLVDLLLGIIPLAGPVMDIFFRANLRNLALLLAAIERSRAAKP